MGDIRDESDTMLASRTHELNTELPNVVVGAEPERCEHRFVRPILPPEALTRTGVFNITRVRCVGCREVLDLDKLDTLRVSTSHAASIRTCECHGVEEEKCPAFLARTRIRHYQSGQPALEHFNERRGDDPHDVPSAKRDGLTLRGAILRDLKDSPAFHPSVNSRQVGGEHYGLSAFQHWDIVAMFNLDYFQGQITKYVMRWKKKGGIQDLKKAQHFLEKYITVEEERAAKEAKTS